MILDVFVQRGAKDIGELATLGASVLAKRLHLCLFVAEATSDGFGLAADAGGGTIGVHLLLSVLTVYAVMTFVLNIDWIYVIL